MGSEQVQLLRTIHQYAERVLEQAQQKNMAKKKVKAEKKCGSYEGGREKSVFTIPMFRLANFLLAVGSAEMRAC